MKVFKHRLQEARKKEGLTQKDVATELNIPISTYQNYERQGKNGRNPDLETLAKIADILNTTTDYLLGRE